MAVEGIAELVEALTTQDYASVVGTPESSWIDFKQTLYPTDPAKPLRLSAKGKWELCKDIAAFANAEGGVIVLGFKEVESLDQGVKVAGEVTPILVENADLSHYKDVFNGGMYPTPKVEMRWHATGTPPEGVLLINVRPQASGVCVLRRMMNGEEPIESFGIPWRSDDRTLWYPAERVHHLLASKAESSAPSVAATPSIPAADHKERAERVRDELMGSSGWDDEALFILQVVPVAGPNRLTGFFDEVKAQLERPERVRAMGFDLTALGGSADVVEGSLLLAGRRDMVARLEPDGLFTVMAKPSSNFLGWAVNKDEDTVAALRINSTVLVELTYSVCLFARNVLRAGGLVDFTYTVECSNFMKSNVLLAPDRPGPFPEYQKATSDTWIKSLGRSDSPENDAYRILTEVYALFGMSEKVIPYIQDEGVSASQLTELNKNPY